jgi:hypothetical protein
MHFKNIITLGFTVLSASAIAVAAPSSVSDGLVTVINNTAFTAAVGPGPLDPSPKLIQPGQMVKDRRFAKELFVYRDGKGSLADNGYPFNFDVTPGAHTLTLTRTSTQRGKYCILKPALTSLQCHVGTYQPCHLTVTFKPDNSVDFFDGFQHHDAQLSSSCTAS